MQPKASVTPTMNTELPVAVGVPDNTPAALSESPAGSAPLVNANVNGATPRLVVSAWL